MNPKRHQLMYGLWVEKDPASIKSESETCVLGNTEVVDGKPVDRYFLVTTVENLALAVKELRGE